MSEAEVPAQKPLASYALPRRDESVVAHMPQSVAPARAQKSLSSPRHAAASAPAHVPVSSPAPAPLSPVSASVPSPLSAPLHTPFSAEMREEERTMIARSRFGDDMSVHEERTVIGQIPREALEFERMFAQRTQPPPAHPADAPSTTPPPPEPALGSPALPSFSSAPPPEGSAADTAPPAAPTNPEETPSESADTAPPGPASSQSQEPPEPDASDKPTSDSRGLVSMAEATHPSVARSASARRLRVTVATLLVLVVLVGLFMIQKSH